VIAAAVAVLAAAALSACVSIPSSGPATEGFALSGGSGNGTVEYNPDGPANGASQQDILRGFTAAFASSTGGYAVARQFLASDFASKWDPRQSVQVRTGAPHFTELDPFTIDYSYNTVATVDSSGSYKQAAQSSSLPFSFVKQSGQWRISSAPNGIVLTDQIFDRVFGEHALYFLDQSNQHLIPDLRWFPSGTTAATRIVTALLNGPPSWLKGAAFSAFPDGTQLSNSGSLVTVDSGVARVDLTKEAATLDLKERQFMKLQLLYSLRSVASISNVSISVQGTELAIGDLGPNGPQPDAKVDGQALVWRRAEFGFYANNRVAPIIGLSLKVVALKPTAATLSSNGDVLAVRGDAGVSVVRQTAPAVLLDSRPGLIDPSMDEDGYVWSVPAAEPNSIRVFDTGNVQHVVNPALPADAQIVSLEISRDGARVAILLSTSTGSRLIVAAILRDPDQKQVPVTLGPPIVDVPLAEGDATDATWVDDLTVAALVTESSQSSVQLFAIGGKRTTLGAPLPAAVEIVGGNGQSGLRVLSDDLTIRNYQGSSWQSSGVKVDFIATQR
jgi:hypothetical protein